jgi:hemerythrin
MYTEETKNQTWNKSYFLDIEMIDKQHSKFFMLFDELTELNNSSNPEAYNRLSEVIDELEKYTRIHFQTEEALMRKANAPDIDLHLVQHNLFETKVEEFKSAYKYKNALLFEQMIGFMRKWFLMHISEVDKK